jgi:hypothetical protein
VHDSATTVDDIRHIPLAFIFIGSHQRLFQASDQARGVVSIEQESAERVLAQGHYVRPFEDWGKLVGDVPSATAILDRFLHHAEVISITGKSYRLRDRALAAEPTGGAAKPANAPISPAGADAKGKSKRAVSKPTAKA